jgi:hypothetical protein
MTPTSGYPVSSVTVTLGSWCQGGAATATWCVKDKNGTAPPVAGATPYTLWRYTGSSCSGTGTKWASNLVDPPSVSAGKIFNSSFVSAPTLTPATTGGTLSSGTYSYDITAVLAGGVEIPGVVASVTVASGLTNTITVSWPAYPSATSYNVYGRGNGSSVTLLKNVTSGTSYLDTGPTSLTANPLTLPSTTIGVASTAGFNSGTNAIVFGASGVVTCSGTTVTSFTGCIGGQPGQYATGTPVYGASTARPPNAILSVSLAVDETPADSMQRFTLSDNIVLRNSRPS